MVTGPRKGCEQVGGGDRRPEDPVKGLHQDLGLGMCGQCSTVPQTQIGVHQTLTGGASGSTGERLNSGAPEL